MKPYEPNLKKLAGLDVYEYRKLCADLICEMHRVAKDPTQTADAKVKAANAIPRIHRAAFETDLHVSPTKVEDMAKQVRRIEKAIANIYGNQPARVGTPKAGEGIPPVHGDRAH